MGNQMVTSKIRELFHARFVQNQIINASKIIVVLFHEYTI